MEAKERPVECFIGGYRNDRIDPVLSQQGLCHGLVVFAIPSLGIMFKCRAEGDSVELEFGAFFSLLKFIKTKLAEEKIASVRVFSSNPQFVFAFTGNSRYMAPGSTRQKLLKEYAGNMQIAVGYVEPYKNKTIISPADYPSLPVGQKSTLIPDLNESKKAEFRPFQRGVKL